MLKGKQMLDSAVFTEGSPQIPASLCPEWSWNLPLVGAVSVMQAVGVCSDLSSLNWDDVMQRRDGRKLMDADRKTIWAS